MPLDPDPSLDRTPSKGLARDPPASGLAILSLVLGIASFTLSVAIYGLGHFGLVLLPFNGAVAGIITGHFALGQILRSNGTISGSTMAKTGLLFTYLQVVLWIIAVLSLIFVFIASMNMRPG